MKKAYGITSDSINVDSYTLKNENCMELTVITYGGIITSLKVPNKRGVAICGTSFLLFTFLLYVIYCLS